MKKLLLFLVVAIPFFGSGQSYIDSIPFDNGTITFVQVIDIPGMSDKDLYEKTKLLISDIYNSAEAVTDVDIPNSSLVIKGISYYPLKDWLGTVEQKLEHTLKIDFKNEKIRLTYTDLVVHTVNAECLIKPCKGFKYPKKVRIEHAKGILSSWNEILESFRKKILKSDSDDW